MAIIDGGVNNPHRKSKTLISVCLIIVLAVSLIALSLLQSQESNDTPSEFPAPAEISYTVRDPIYIDSNDGFNISNGVVSGSGTALDPYIIADWDINASSADGIKIRNTDAHFIIMNCYMHDGGVIWKGIFIINCVNGTVTGNNCSNNDYGIYLYSSSNNTLSNNTCNLNNNYGIYLYSLPFASSSDHNTLSNNNCSNNDYGIYLYSSDNNTLSNNNCSNNDYGIILSSSSDNTLSNNNCSNNNCGIFLSSLSDNTLSNNNCSNNNYGIFLSSSSDNTLSNNNCSNNNYGIFLGSSSDYNTLIWNHLCENSNHGVYISSGSFNIIWNNTFIGNNGATSTYNSSHIQAYDSGTDNWWNSALGYGNYWSDWTTPDAVAPWGIVDNPYNISGSAGAKDFYPQTTVPIIPEPPIFFIVGIMVVIFMIFSRKYERE